MTPRLLPSAPITDPRQNLKAIELMVLATVRFAFLDATAKYLVTVEAILVVQATLTSLHLPHRFQRGGALALRVQARATLGEAHDAGGLLRYHGRLDGVQFRRTEISLTRLDHHHFLPYPAPRGGACRSLSAPWHRLVAIAVGFAGVLIVMHPGVSALR
jgi:hypothetical protein